MTKVGKLLNWYILIFVNQYQRNSSCGSSLADMSHRNCWNVMGKLFYSDKRWNQYRHATLLRTLFNFYKIMVKLTNINSYRLKIWHVSLSYLIFLTEKKYLWSKFSKIVSYFSPAILVNKKHTFIIFTKRLCSAQLTFIVFSNLILQFRQEVWFQTHLWPIIEQYFCIF